MSKLVLVLAALAVVFIAESSCQRFILPTYRPPPRTHSPVIRVRREPARDEPLWLFQRDIPRAPSTAEHPVLPQYIDDVKIDPHRRYARSYSTPSRGGHLGRTSEGARGGISGGRGRDTGATHPGHNRRNARDIRLPFPTPFNPKPRYPPIPDFPSPRRIPVYV